MSSRQTQGAYTEAIASDYLQQHGLTLITRNYHCAFGEIDLIMHDQDCLVCVEVRYRRQAEFGGALGSVTRTKQKRLLKTALDYLQHHSQWQQLSIRFDVVTLEGNNSVVDQWIKNAFLVEEGQW